MTWRPSWATGGSSTDAGPDRKRGTGSKKGDRKRREEKNPTMTTEQIHEKIRACGMVVTRRFEVYERNGVTWAYVQCVYPGKRLDFYEFNFRKVGEDEWEEVR